MDTHLKEDVQAAGNGRAFGITRDRRKKKSFLPLQHRNNERFSQKNAVHAHITLVPQNAEQTQTAFVPQGAGRRTRR